MVEPPRAHTLSEVRYYLMVAPCTVCGKGPREIDLAPGAPGPDRRVTVHTRCRACGDEGQEAFVVTHDASAQGPGAEVINPAGVPSEIIDLGQWLSLFYLLVESASTEESKSAARRDGYRASLCLAEALKFYGDDELPPESAFFSEASATAFREHPEKFARQRLLDMRAKLPSHRTMAGQVARDERAPKSTWWQFWRR